MAHTRCIACRTLMAEGAYVCYTCAFGGQENVSLTREREPRVESAGHTARVTQARLARETAHEQFTSIQGVSAREREFPGNPRNAMIQARKTINVNAIINQIRSRQTDPGYSAVGPYIVDNDRQRRKRNRIAYVAWRRAWIQMWESVGKACART